MKNVLIAFTMATLACCSVATAADLYPTTRAEVEAIAETAVDGDVVHMHAALLENYVQQLMEDFCFFEGVQIGDATYPGADTGGIQDIYAPKKAKKAIKLLGGVDADDIVSLTNAVLAGLTTLAVDKDQQFCMSTAKYVTRGVAVDPNPELWALMCLPTGPEGALQTVEVHIDDVAYWVDNGGTTGACEGSDEPPAH